MVLAGSNAAREFLEPIFAERDQEMTLVTFCDERLRVVQLLAFPGCKDRSAISVQEVVRYGIGSAGIIVAHNHPSGSPQPSQADLNLTRRLCLVSQAIDVQLLDHLIFAAGEMFSLRRAGLI